MRDQDGNYLGVSSPNFTQTPNELFDDVMADVSGNDWKVVSYISRHTFGYGKAFDNISLSQICSGLTTEDGRVLDRGTGLPLSSVKASLKNLLDQGIITRTRHQSHRYGHEPTTYSIKMVDPLGQPLAKGSQPLATLPHSANHPLGQPLAKGGPPLAKDGPPLATQNKENNTLSQIVDLPGVEDGQELDQPSLALSPPTGSRVTADHKLNYLDHVLPVQDQDQYSDQKLDQREIDQKLDQRATTLLAGAEASGTDLGSSPSPGTRVQDLGLPAHLLAVAQIPGGPTPLPVALGSPIAIAGGSGQADDLTVEEAEAHRVEVMAQHQQTTTTTLADQKPRPGSRADMLAKMAAQRERVAAYHQAQAEAQAQAQEAKDTPKPPEAPPAASTAQESHVGGRTDTAYFRAYETWRRHHPGQEYMSGGLCKKIRSFARSEAWPDVAWLVVVMENTYEECPEDRRAGESYTLDTLARYVKMIRASNMNPITWMKDRRAGIRSPYQPLGVS
jgi:hypothetical protein